MSCAGAAGSPGSPASCQPPFCAPFRIIGAITGVTPAQLGSAVGGLPGQRLLVSGREEEGKVVAIKEYSEAGADDRLAVRRVREPDPGLEGPVVRVDHIPQSRFEVPSQSVVDREPSIESPLILRKKAGVSRGEQRASETSLSSFSRIAAAGPTRRRHLCRALDRASRECRPKL
jgi:hypothetical protein